MKRELFLGLFLSAAGFLAAENPADAVGQDPDIVLPPMFLEIEDSTKENVTTALPGSGAAETVVLPELTVPMPDPTESEFDDGQIDAFLATVGGQGALSDSGNQTVRTLPVGLDGHAGLGTVGEIELGFSLFGNTEKSSFRFSSDHHSRDGFGFRPWGGAFFDRENRFSGSHSFRDRVFGNEFEGSFFSRAFGTQELTVENDARRDLFFAASDRFSLDAEALRFEASVGFDMVHRYTQDVGVGATDLFLDPRAELSVLLPNAKLKFGTGYAWNGSLFAGDHGHSADFLFEFDAELPKAVNLSGGIGLFWDSRERSSVYGTDFLGFTIPFYLQIYGSASDFFQYRFKGGFENERRSYAELTREFRYPEPVALTALSGWFAEAELDFRIRRLAVISVGLDFDRKSGTLLIDDMKVNPTGLISVTQGIENLLFAFFRTRVNPVEGLDLAVGWEGSLLPANRYYFKPRHCVDGRIEYTIPRRWFTFMTQLRFEYYDRAYIPEWDWGARFRIGDHFSLSLALDDLLSPIYKEGRPTVWGGYIDPGLGASIQLEIKY